MTIFLYVLFHIACGVVAFGAWLGYFQRKYPITKESIENATFFSIGGPISLMTMLLTGGFKYGFMWRLQTPEESYAKMKKMDKYKYIHHLTLDEYKTKYPI